jgi:uncharacterized iron-regulated membrane protein
MIRRIARYVVKESEIDNVRSAIEEFIAAIKEYEPETVCHAYQAVDDLSFVHVMAFPDAEAERSHSIAPYTGTFLTDLYPRCDETPVFTDLVLVSTTDNA